MLSGLIRFAIVWGLSRALAPYLERAMDRALARLPSTGILHAVAAEIRDRQSTTLVRSLGETAGELIFGPKNKGRR